VSVQSELHFHADLYCHRLAVFHRGLELPGLDCLDCLLVETHSEIAANFNVARLAIGADDQPQHTGSLIFGLPGFFRVFRLRLINRLGRGDAAAYPEYPATRTTAAALAYARTGAHTNSAAGTRANATARAGAVRRRPGGQARHGIT